MKIAMELVQAKLQDPGFLQSARKQSLTSTSTSTSKDSVKVDQPKLLPKFVKSNDVAHKPIGSRPGFIKSDAVVAPKKTAPSPNLCERCDKPGHDKNACISKHNQAGDRLPRQEDSIYRSRRDAYFLLKPPVVAAIEESDSDTSVDEHASSDHSSASDNDCCGIFEDDCDFQFPPSPRLVGIETNPGPLCSRAPNSIVATNFCESYANFNLDSVQEQIAKVTVSFRDVCSPPDMPELVHSVSSSDDDDDESDSDIMPSEKFLYDRSFNHETLILDFVSSLNPEERNFYHFYSDDCVIEGASKVECEENSDRFLTFSLAWIGKQMQTNLFHQQSFFSSLDNIEKLNILANGHTHLTVQQLSENDQIALIGSFPNLVTEQLI
jgi:hypothetical protein